MVLIRGHSSPCQTHSEDNLARVRAAGDPGVDALHGLCSTFSLPASFGGGHESSPECNIAGEDVARERADVAELQAEQVSIADDMRPAGVLKTRAKRQTGPEATCFERMLVLQVRCVHGGSAFSFQRTFRGASAPYICSTRRLLLFGTRPVQGSTAALLWRFFGDPI